MSDFYAHIKTDLNGETEVQTCQAHCLKSAEYAKNVLSGINLGEIAYTSGILHDCGKFTEVFQTYIERSAAGDEVKRGSVNHTFAGARYILERYHNNQEGAYVLTSEIIAYAIGAHHGLFDCVREDHKNGFVHRMTKKGISYHEAIDNFFNYFLTKNDLDKAFQRSVSEVDHSLRLIQGIVESNDDADEDNGENELQELNFYLGMLTRLVLSAVIEGDRRDTSEFFRGEKRFEHTASKLLWKEVLYRVEKKLITLKSTTEISMARAILSDLCKKSASRESGIYRLEMPTGSGKTLTSLRYAIAHAEKWNKKRIIFVTPLLSILDQNAAVIKEYVNDNRIILEHHSNIIRPIEGIDEYDQWEYYTETWHSPIIITTMVQFLNVLFSGKLSAVRRMQSLCESVIVIDEVQTVPVKMLSLFNSALNFLQAICKATIILSSATQPCFDKTHYPLRNVKGNLIHYNNDVKDLFERTIISQLGTHRLGDLIQLVQEIVMQCNSLLIVCNKKDEAKFLFEQIRHLDMNVFHLSASMCIQHRKDVLEKIGKALDESTKLNIPVICVSTQVIEAGVDISFEKAIRFTAGIDSIIQTAGRCNRNGENDKGNVFIFSCMDENLNRIMEIKKAKMATEDLLAEYTKNPLLYDNSIESQQAINYYYRKYYESFAEGYTEYTVHGNENIYNLMSQNKQYAGINQGIFFYLNQAFASAGNEFKVFDTEGIDVIVPYGRGKELIVDLTSEKAMRDDKFVISTLEEAKLYTVTLYAYQIGKLSERGALYELFEGRAVVLQYSYYDEQMGVIDEDKNYGYLEVSL